MSRSKLMKSTSILLTIVFLLAVSVRLIHFGEITFFYDQARDAFESINIIKDADIKVIGPSTDIQGLRHGPLYWYIIAPIYYLTRGNVYAVRLFLILLGSCSVFVMYFLTKLLTKNREMSLLAAFTIAFSFEAVQYSRWLSNPAPAFLTIPLFWSGLWLIHKNSKYGLPLSLLGLFLCMQFQLFLLYLSGFLFLLIVLKLLRKNLKNIFVFDKQTLPIYFFAFLFSSTFILAEIKFKFLGTISLINHFLQGGSDSTNFLSKINHFPLSLANNINNNFQVNTTFGYILLLLLIIASIYLFLKNKNDKGLLLFLWIWFLSPFIVHLLSGYFAYFTNIGNTFPLIILATYTLSRILVKIRLKHFIYILVSLLAILNIYHVIKVNSNGETLFAIQKRMLIPDQLAVIDWIYKNSDKKPFAINSVTNPLFINTTWSYLFDWYGKSTYGYLPSWRGYPQDDQPGFSAPFNDKNLKLGDNLFLILEPIGGIPESYPKAYQAIEDSRSILIESKKIGTITIEKRKLINWNAFSRDDLMKIILK